MSKNDLNPYAQDLTKEQNQKKATDEKKKFATDEDLKGKSAEERVKILRENPKLLAKFV